jgi:hypothetical protein
MNSNKIQISLYDNEQQCIKKFEANRFYTLYDYKVFEGLVNPRKIEVLEVYPDKENHKTMLRVFIEGKDYSKYTDGEIINAFKANHLIVDIVN